MITQSPCFDKHSCWDVVDLLQEQATKVTGAEMRRSFLENVAAHREIIQAWEQAQGGDSLSIIDR